MTETILTVLVVAQLIASYLLRQQVKKAGQAIHDLATLAQAQHREVCGKVDPLLQREQLVKMGRELIRQRLAERAQKAQQDA